MESHRRRLLVTSGRVDERTGADPIRPSTAATIDALDALYREHSLDVYRYLRARVDTDDEAAELTAITFERALRAFERFKPEGAGARAWLIRIARNAAIDASRARRHVVSRTDGVEATPSRDAPVERLAELRVLLAGLPEEQRDVLHLRYAGGLTASEIGRVIGKSEAAAQKIVSRALASLREAYRDDG